MYRAYGELGSVDLRRARDLTCARLRLRLRLHAQINISPILRALQKWETALWYPGLPENISR
jgi:hypothetical protein